MGPWSQLDHSELVHGRNPLLQCSRPALTLCLIPSSLGTCACPSTTYLLPALRKRVALKTAVLATLYIGCSFNEREAKHKIQQGMHCWEGVLDRRSWSSSTSKERKPELKIDPRGDESQGNATQRPLDICQMLVKASSHDWTRQHVRLQGLHALAYEGDDGGKRSGTELRQSTGTK